MGSGGVGEGADGWFEMNIRMMFSVVGGAVDSVSWLTFVVWVVDAWIPACGEMVYYIGIGCGSEKEGEERCCWGTGYVHVEVGCS